MRGVRGEESHMDIETAKLIVDTFEDVHARIFSLLGELQSRCSPDKYALLKREIARVVNGVDSNLYPIVMRRYPGLDPLRERS
jgi:hypothetical protein